MALVAVACQPRNEQTLSAIDGLLAVVKQTDSLNQTFPTVQVNQRLADFSALHISAATASDSARFSRTLTELSMAVQALQKCRSRHEAINNECRTTTKQLEALRVDMKNGALHPDSAMHYIDTEFQYVQALNEAVFELTEKTALQLTTFDAWHDSLKTVIAP